MFLHLTNTRDKEMEYILTTLKVFGITALAALLDWVMPIKTFIAITLLLVMADLFTGIAAARARQEIVHSKGLRRTALKFSMYTISIFGAHAMQTVYFKGFPMVFTISAYISVTEFWSVLENVGVVTNTNVLEAVRSQLSGFLKKEK